MTAGLNRVIVIFGRAITLDSLKHNCRVVGFPDGYADLLWRSYWTKRDAGQDRSGALNELVRICFDENEQRALYGKRFEEK